MNNQFKTLSLVLLMVTGFFCINMNAQDVNRCYTTEYVEQLKEKYPDLEASYQQVEDDIINYNLNGKLNSFKKANAIITIPVVVHVVYNNAVQNISDDQIFSQIEVLNEDFRRLNSDASGTPSMFSGVAADCEIEFCLAAVDPDGAPTTGITRRQTNVSTFTIANEDIKSFNQGGQNPWPRADYLNLWVGPIESDILGYATPPGGVAFLDGVVIDNESFGKGSQFPNIQFPYNKGRTCTHEVGHWLGLSHVWGNGGGSCTQDDGIADTPNQEEANYGCPSISSAISCGSTDMFMNYMDYVNDACMNLFTIGQKDRMLDILNTSRSSIQNSISNCEVFEPVVGFLPLSENFENNGEFEQEGWVLQNPDNDTWQWAQSTVSADGMGTGSAFFDNYGVNSDNNNNPDGTEDHMITPILNFTGSTIINFSFDVAYARYDNDFYDSLLISYSIDLGQNWTYFYLKGGQSGLPTAADTDFTFVPTANDWRTEEISPGTFVNIINQPQVLFRFTNLSGWGNNIYIDNIAIQSNVFPLAIEESELFNVNNTVITYPNPVADGQLNINTSNYTKGIFNMMNIYDASGKVVVNRTLNSNGLFQIDTKSLAAGIYVLKLIDDGGNVVTKKVLIGE